MTQRLCGILAIVFLVANIACMIVGLTMLHDPAPAWWVAWLWSSSALAVVTGWAWFDKAIRG